MSRVVAIVQARVGSKRLPGKVLRPLQGEPAVVHVMRRVAECKAIDAVYLATSDRAENDALESLARDHAWSCYRGSETDVVSRFSEIVRKDGADVVVRVCADNMAIDPEALSRGILERESRGLDLCSPFIDDFTYPFGAGAEIATAACLFRVDDETRGAEPQYREHVFAWALDHRDRFRVGPLDAPPGLTRPELCISVDTPEDFERMRALYGELAPVRSQFTLTELIAAWDRIHGGTRMEAI